MPKLFDRVKVNTPTTGSGDVTFGAASSNAFLTPTEAGCVDGDTVRYVIVDGTDYEEGVGTIGSGVAAMARTTVARSKIGGTAGTSKINLSGTAMVAFTALAADILNPANNLADVASASAALKNLAVAGLLRGYLAKLTLSTAGSSSSFGVAAGVATDSTSSDMMMLAAAITKTTASWAAGSGNGALDTGSIANSTWYHVHLIKRPDTGAVDALVSLSATAPTMPANYTLSRRIGSMLTDSSGKWRSFSQFGDEFLWGVGSAINDINTTTLGTTPTLFTLRVPTGVKVWAKLRMDSIASSVLVSSPDEGALAFNTPVSNQTTNSSTSVASLTLDIRTNTSAQVQAVGASSSQTLQVTVFGWIDRRGKDGAA